MYWTIVSVAHGKEVCYCLHVFWVTRNGHITKIPAKVPCKKQHSNLQPPSGVRRDKQIAQNPHRPWERVLVGMLRSNEILVPFPSEVTLRDFVPK